MKVRLYIKESLASGGVLALGDEQSHYLKTVLRRKIGDDIFVFNERDGEFESRIFEAKRHVGLKIVGQVRGAPPLEEPKIGVFLAISVVKSDAFFDIVTKAVELGTSGILPLKTKHSVAALPRFERCTRVILEALEQCERMVPPALHNLANLSDFLESLEEGDLLVFCNERAAQERAMLRVLPHRLAGIKRVFVLVGPEGGFSREETAALLANKFALEVSLSDGILRAQTAAVCALFGVSAIIAAY